MEQLRANRRQTGGGLDDSVFVGRCAPGLSGTRDGPRLFQSLPVRGPAAAGVPERRSVHHGDRNGYRRRGCRSAWIRCRPGNRRISRTGGNEFYRARRESVHGYRNTRAHRHARRSNRTHQSERYGSDPFQRRRRCRGGARRRLRGGGNYGILDRTQIQDSHIRAAAVHQRVRGRADDGGHPGRGPAATLGPGPRSRIRVAGRVGDGRAGQRTRIARHAAGQPE